MAAWPTSVATDANLHLVKNNLATTLNGGIDDVTTTVVLTDASAFPAEGYVTIGTEAIHYTGKSTNTLTGVTRGADGTTAASHTDTDPVLHYFVAAHHNDVKDEVIALETDVKARIGDGSDEKVVVSAGNIKLTSTGERQIAFNRTDGYNNPTFKVGRIASAGSVNQFRVLYEDSGTSETPVLTLSPTFASVPGLFSAGSVHSSAFSVGMTPTPPTTGTTLSLTTYVVSASGASYTLPSNATISAADASGGNIVFVRGGASGTTVHANTGQEMFGANTVVSGGSVALTVGQVGMFVYHPLWGGWFVSVMSAPTVA